PLEGKLSAHLAMHGTQKKLAGDGSVRIVNAAAWGQPIQSIAAKLHGEGGVINATAILKSTAGDANGSITYNLRNEQYDGEITIPELRLSELELVRQRSTPVNGNLSISARGHGSIKSPELAASISSPRLRIGEETFTDFKINAQAARGTASIVANSSVAGASLHAEGTVGLGRDYPADLTFSTNLVDIAPWLRGYLNAGSVRGQLELSGWVKGPLKDPNQVLAHVTVPTLHLGYGTFDLANASPVSIDFKDGIFTVSPAKLRGPDTEIHIQGSAPLEARGPVSATARGDISLGILKLFFPQWDCSGSAHLDVTVEGSRNKPDFRGQMQIVNAMFEPPNFPVGIEKLNAVLALSRDRVNIQSLTAEAGGGPVSARGFISYNHGLQFNLGVTGRSVRVRYPKGVRVVLNGNLTLTGSQASSVIGGQVLIDRLSFTQSFDLASLANELSAGSATAPSPGLAGRVNLNVAVRSDQELSLNSTALSLRGSADLRVRGTLADPVVLGRASLTGGQLFFNGNRYQLQNGVVTFNNPVSTEPVVNLRVTTTVKQYSLSVNFTGPFDRMRTTYTSDPPLPPLDILNLLLRGQTAEAPSSGFGAQALVAQGLAGQVSSRVQKLAGLSSLTIDPQVGGHGTNPGARIGVQEQVTRKLFFTFSVDVTTAQDDVVQLEYQISRRLSLQAVRDQNSGYSLEIKVHKSF
ncbi:MAG: translocation/assembly module TamB domain-containing protein, partial [Acidobacteriota bacterium]|nr:translocation/assembly module TamB domain-containing protein [Acidobacteriota bacterium]